MTQLERAYEILFIGALIVLAVLVILCLIRAILGPSMADRIVAVNMIGTLTIMMIAILSVHMQEGYLVDVCLVYAMLSFLAVVVLSKISMTVYLKKQKQWVKEEQELRKQEGETNV